MRKFLVLFLFVFAYTNLSAQNAKDVIQSCVTAMRLDKLDSFKTASIRASLYLQGQKTSIRYFAKDYGEGDDADTKLRFEMSSMGNETAIVFADEEIFQVVPKYEELDKEDIGPIYQIMGLLLPTMGISPILKDTTDELILTLQTGTTKFNDKNCKKISVSLKEKPDEMIQHLFFDETTNWFQGLEQPYSNGSITTICSGFKRKSGYVYPTTIKLLLDGKKMSEIEIDKFDVDINIEDSIFERKK